MTADHVAEVALIEASRIQRRTLERWFRVLVDAGEFAEAERLRGDLAALDAAESCTAKVLPFPGARHA